MRFFITSNIKSNPSLYATVLIFLLSSLIYWTINWFFYAMKFGITPEGMLRYFFTDPQFPERIPLSKLLEDVHIQLFLYTIFLLVLSSLFLHKRSSETLKIVLVVSSFLSALGDILSSFGIYFLGGIFIHLRILMFLSFQLSTGAMLFLTLKLYLTKEKEENKSRGLLYSIVFLFGISSILFAVLNFFLFSSKIGFGDISAYYAGDPERFIRPKSLEGMMEVIVPHTVGMGVYLFALVHFAFFTNIRHKVLLSVLTLSSGVVDNLSPLLIRFVSQEFSYLKLISFFLLNLSLFYTSLQIVISIIRHRAKVVLIV